MNKELLERADSLWERVDKAGKFESRYNVYPYSEGGRLVNDLQRLSEEIPQVHEPKITEEVYENELKRRLSGDAVYLEHALSGHSYSLEDVISIYGIDSEADINSLRDWLIANREEALDTVDRVYQATEAGEYRLSVPRDIPSFRRQAEEYATTQVGNYHQKLGKLFSRLTPVGNFLRDITAVPTHIDRSYFNPLTKSLQIEIEGICYITQDQTLHLNEGELLRLIGHEGMGHALNAVATDASDLPNFLKRGNSLTTAATVESIGQHYEEIIFDDLSHSPETQRELGIEHKFESMYQNQKDTQLIKQYRNSLFHYALTVLADPNLPSMSNPESRAEGIQARVNLISEVSLYPGQAIRIVEGYQNDFDSRGNLSFNYTKELKYAAKPAQRVIDNMTQRGIPYGGKDRGKIDLLLLTGFWTPIGLVENAQVTKV